MCRRRLFITHVCSDTNVVSSEMSHLKYDDISQEGRHRWESQLARSENAREHHNAQGDSEEEPMNFDEIMSFDNDARPSQCEQ